MYHCCVDCVVSCSMLVTSWLCDHSPARGCRRCMSACSAGASWDTGAWKHWAGRWCSKEAECCYWSHCGSRCPCHPQHCLGPRLITQSEGARQKDMLIRSKTVLYIFLADKLKKAVNLHTVPCSISSLSIIFYHFSSIYIFKMVLSF